MTAQPLANAPVPRHAPQPGDVPHPADVPIPPELQARDWIFNDPASYRAGVREALAWVAASADHARAVAMQSALRPAQPTPQGTRPAPRPSGAVGS